MASSIISTYNSTFTASSVIPSRRSSEYLREFLHNAVTPKNTISFVYKETLKSLLVLFSDLYYIDSEGSVIKVKCIYANQERSIADILNTENLTLPIVSVSHFTTLPDPNRQRNESNVVQETLWDSKKLRAFRVISLAPRAVDIIYNINIWSKYHNPLDQLTERIFSEFNPGKVINTRFNQYTKAFLLAEEDGSAYEVENGQDRILKKSFNISVETYIPQAQYVLTSTGAIEEFNTEMYLNNSADEEILGSNTVIIDGSTQRP